MGAAVYTVLESLVAAGLVSESEEPPAAGASTAALAEADRHVRGNLKVLTDWAARPAGGTIKFFFPSHISVAIGPSVM